MPKLNTSPGPKSSPRSPPVNDADDDTHKGDDPDNGIGHDGDLSHDGEHQAKIRTRIEPQTTTGKTT